MSEYIFNEAWRALPKKTAKARREALMMIASQGGITPLQIMLEAMEEAYALGGAIAAFPFAVDAAPYCHAKYANMVISRGEDLEPIIYRLPTPEMGVEEWQQTYPAPIPLPNPA